MRPTWSEEELRERLEEEAHRPFDLERGPLVRMHLFRRAADDHIFLLTVHHIVGDFWSLVLVLEEMQALYPAECDGRPAALPAPAREYRDFVRWQADLLAGPEGERLWEYWERQLAGAPTVLDLPTDRPRPPVFSRRGGAVPWRLGPDLVRRLKALAASEATTLYAVLLAAFQVQLGRYTGQEDFLVGCPFAGRSRPGFEDVIGYFINMLPLRADLSGDPPFRALLRRVGATVLDALQHQDYPFPLLVERLVLERDPSRAPLVQVSFTLEKAHRSQQLGAWRFFLPPSGATAHRRRPAGRAVLRRAALQPVRPGDGLRGGGRHRRGDAALQQGPVRRRDGAPDGRPFPHDPGRHRRRPGPPALRAPLADRGRAPAGAPRLERHQRRLPAGAVPAPPVRAAGRTDARRDRDQQRRAAG